MDAKSAVILVVIVGLAMVLYSAAYVVDETQQVIVTQFGDPVGDAIIEPEERWYAVMVPPVRVSTQRVFEELGLTAYGP